MSDVTNTKTTKKSNSKPKKEKIKTNVMFVCTGNTCRSPMAEFIFKSYCASKRKSSLFNVSSAGLYANEGDPVTDTAIEALKRLKVKVTPRTAVLLTPALASNADLIVCMTASHARALASLGDKVKTVAQITGGPEVPDPFGGDIDVYLKTAEYLKYAAADVYAVAMRISELKNRISQ